jgi:resuscitation-promoting factor RpfA
VGRHSKPSRAKNALLRTGAAAVLAGVAAGTIGIAGAGTANAMPGQPGLVMCESGGNPHAVNNTAAGIRAGRPAGLFQIVTGTWLANGGGAYAPTADKATPAQQQAVADRIYARQGSAPWQCKPGSGPAAFADFGSAGAGAAAAPVTKKSKKSATVHTPKTAPKAPKAPKTHKSAPKAVAPATGQRYTVVAGDTLSEIAHKFHVHGGWRHLQAVNGVHNANLIYVGQTLNLG